MVINSNYCCWRTIARDFLPALILILTILYLYKHFIYHYKYWKTLGVPHTDPVPLLGHFADPTLGRKSSVKTIDSLYKRFQGHRYFGMYQLRHPMLVLRDPELVNVVLTRDFSSFHDRVLSRKSFEYDPLFENLVNLRGEKWKSVRAKLSSTFTVVKLKAMFGDLRVCTYQLIDKLLELTSDGQATINVTDISSKYTTDTIGRCAFGLDCNSLSDSDSAYRRAGLAVFKPTLRSSLFNFIRLINLGSLLDVFKLRSMPDHVYEFFLNLFQNTMELRKTEKEDRNDFVSILIKMRNEEKANSSHIELFTDSVLSSNAFIFFAAGFETTASTISYCLYELALNRHVQVELRNEINKVLKENGGKISYDVIKNMTYLDMVLNETMRMHPPAPALLRVCTKKYKIPDSDITLDVGTKVLVPVYSLHYDEKYYHQPEIFDPQRFTEENKSSRPNNTFLPFGDGPRICIGLRFAMMEAKTGLAEILSKFEILPCESTQIPIELNPRSMLLTPKEPICLSFKKII